MRKGTLYRNYLEIILQRHDIICTRRGCFLWDELYLMNYGIQCIRQNYRIQSFYGTCEHTLSPAYNELFDAKKSARYSRVLIVTKLVVARILLIVQCSYQGTILSHLMSTNH